MIEAPNQRMLIVGGTDADHAWARDALGEGGDSPWSVEQAVDLAAAMAYLGHCDIELVVFCLDNNVDELGCAALRRLREFAFSIPIVCLADVSTDSDALAIVRAGAHEYLSRNGLNTERFRRAVRFAIARGSFLQTREERQEHAARDREIGGLNTIGGPAPLPVAGRSFGMMPLIDRAPQKFSDLTTQYADLLDLALEERTVRVESRLGEALNGLADRLGLLGAGPRDIIDLHKAAITNRLEGQSIRKARAYVEEGRLMLLQIMGFLASFYRHLSWGTVADPRGRISRDQIHATVPTTTGKAST